MSRATSRDMKRRAIGVAPSRKVMQVVWIPEDLFIKIVGYASAKNVTYNVAIVEILKEYFTERRLYACPACGNLFSNVEDLKAHAKMNRDHIKKFLEGAIQSEP